MIYPFRWARVVERRVKANRNRVAWYLNAQFYSAFIINFQISKQLGLLYLALLKFLRRTFCFLECAYRDSTNTWISVWQSMLLLILSWLYCRGSLFLLLLSCRRHLKVLEQLHFYYHPVLKMSLTSMAWQVAQRSSKMLFPDLESPSGTFTSGSLIYFFFFPPITWIKLINKQQFFYTKI